MSSPSPMQDDQSTATAKHQGRDSFLTKEDSFLTKEAKRFIDASKRCRHTRRARAYSPSLEELKSMTFASYVRKVLLNDENDNGGESSEEEVNINNSSKESDGIAKVTLPKGWLKKTGAITEDTTARGKDWQAGTKLGDMQVNGPIKQVVAGIGGVYEYTLLDMPPSSLAEFRDKADAYRKRQIGSSSQNDFGDDETCEELARKMWKRIGVTMEPSMYGADMEGSLFDKDDPACGWNLQNLDSCLQLLSADTSTSLPGVTSPYLYIGMWASVFCAHTEDMNLLSINYLHSGAPKYWYAIAARDAKRFESLAESRFASSAQECKEFLRHKRSLLSPAILKRAGIPYTTQVQRPGDAIITFPGSYHFGFNLGFNVAEATNFGVEEWIPKGLQAKVCMCHPQSVRIDMDKFCGLLKQYDEDVENAEKLGYPRLSYQAWAKVEQKRRERCHQLAVCTSTSPTSDGVCVDPTLQQREFWVEVTKPLPTTARAKGDGTKSKKKRKKKDKEDWRLAKRPRPKSLVPNTRVLCLIAPEVIEENSEDLCFSGVVEELVDNSVRIHFKGLSRNEDVWTSIKSPKIFLDGGPWVEKKKKSGDVSSTCKKVKKKCAKAESKKQKGRSIADVKESYIVSTDPLLQHKEFWVELTPQMQTEDQDKIDTKVVEDWRWAKRPGPMSLAPNTRVLCLLPPKSSEKADEDCFAGVVIEVEDTRVKVRFDGVNREDTWMAARSSKLLLDGGPWVEPEALAMSRQSS